MYAGRDRDFEPTFIGCGADMHSHFSRAMMCLVFWVMSDQENFVSIPARALEALGVKRTCLPGCLHTGKHGLLPPLLKDVDSYHSSVWCASMGWGNLEICETFYGMEGNIVGWACISGVGRDIRERSVGSRRVFPDQQSWILWLDLLERCLHGIESMQWSRHFDAV